MVTVKFFAQLRDAVGTDSLQIAAADLEQVYAQLQHRSIQKLGATAPRQCACGGQSKHRQHQPGTDHGDEVIAASDRGLM